MSVLPANVRADIATRQRLEEAKAIVEKGKADAAKNHFFESNRYVAQVTKRATAARREDERLDEIEHKSLRRRKLQAVYEREWAEWQAELKRKGLAIAART